MVLANPGVEETGELGSDLAVIDPGTVKMLLEVLGNGTSKVQGS